LTTCLTYSQSRGSTPLEGSATGRRSGSREALREEQSEPRQSQERAGVRQQARLAATAVNEQPAHEVIDRVVTERLVVHAPLLIHVGRPLMAIASLADIRMVSQAREVMADVETSRHQVASRGLRAQKAARPSECDPPDVAVKRASFLK
jgi:hypothetical protein